jgi:hypothetical protein
VKFLSSKCKKDCYTYSTIFEQESDRIAQLMQEQVSLIKNGNIAYNSYLSDNRDETLNELKEIILRLREIRNIILNKIDDYEDFISCCKGKKNKDMDLLVAYYLEAGSKREEEFLKEISNAINTKDDLFNLRSLVIKIKSNKDLAYEDDNKRV